MIDAGGNIPLISIVDDDASVRKAMANLVRSIGFAVRSFDSADQYLNSAERHQTACIVSDIQMAGTSGLDLQSNLAAQDDPTPIIFITAFPRPEIKKRALDAGAFCFLSKPFDVVELTLRVETLLGLRFLYRSLRNEKALLEQRVRDRTRSLQRVIAELRCRNRRWLAHRNRGDRSLRSRGA